LIAVCSLFFSITLLYKHWRNLEKLFYTIRLDLLFPPSH
jgi:hypothetical protein